MVRKLLMLLKILQETTIESNTRGFKDSYSVRRVNPYNPLSYIALTIIIIVGVIMFGVVGIRKEINSLNPFKWQ